MEGCVLGIHGFRKNMTKLIGRDWTVLRLYGLGGRLLKKAKSFYVNGRACVRVGNDVSNWFPVRVGLRQGCVMSPWLFNIYMDGKYENVR